MLNGNMAKAVSTMTEGQIVISFCKLILILFSEQSLRRHLDSHQLPINVARMQHL